MPRQIDRLILQAALRTLLDARADMTMLEHALLRAIMQGHHRRVRATAKRLRLARDRVARAQTYVLDR